jgi:hypothetical protein
MTCGAVRTAADVPDPRIDGGELEHADHLVEEDKRKHEAVGVVLGVRRGFVLGDDLGGRGRE